MTSILGTAARLSLAVCVGFLLFAGPSLPQTPAPTTAPAPAPPKVRKTEIISADNWTITCTTLDQAGAKRQCSAELKIIRSDGGGERAVFSWTIGSSDGKPTSVVAVPTGLSLAPGTTLKVGDKEPRKYPYTACFPDHCEAIIALDDALVKALGTVATAEFSAVAANGSIAKFTVNMKGFDEAFAAVAK